MDKIDILLLEDNPGDVYLVKEQLQDIDSCEFQITIAQYLARALKILETKSFAAILVDLTLPDSGGWETFEAIDRAAKESAIVVITASAEKDLAIAAVREGAQDYIVKGKMVPNSLHQTIQYAIERKSFTRQLEQRTAELEYYNQELETFSYAVSHDLKNPLSFIKGMSSLLLSKQRPQPLEEQDRVCIERIHNSSVQMERITRNLLNLSLVQRSQMSIEQVDLSAMARDIVGQLREQNPERQVEFVASEDTLAYADPELINLALENIISNAWKYTKKSTEAKIEFGKSALANTYCVRDNGIGFDLNEAKELFAPFKRLSNSQEFEGTGIGLATVKRIIDRHQGKIWFEAEPKAGAAFFFTLPEH